jgi:hypothetical protein
MFHMNIMLNCLSLLKFPSIFFLQHPNENHLFYLVWREGSLFGTTLHKWQTSSVTFEIWRVLILKFKSFIIQFTNCGV